MHFKDILNIFDDFINDMKLVFPTLKDDWGNLCT